MAYKMKSRTSNGTVTKNGITKGIKYAIKKIKGSFNTKKTGKGPIMPKDHPVTPPTAEEYKKSKGELFERDLTGFRRYDRVGTKEEQKAKKYRAYSSTGSKSQWEHSKKIVKARLKSGKFWGWPIDKWGGGKR
tara:strand:- start:86 stop:484 length:399 start_codon:yes stop_codon:yes gene_type:complete